MKIRRHSHSSTVSSRWSDFLQVQIHSKTLQTKSQHTNSAHMKLSSQHTDVALISRTLVHTQNVVTAHITPQNEYTTHIPTDKAPDIQTCPTVSGDIPCDAQPRPTMQTHATEQVITQHKDPKLSICSATYWHTPQAKLTP